VEFYCPSKGKSYQARRDVLVDGLQKLGWQVEKPRGSMFVWARVSDEHLAGQSTLEFALRMMEEAEVALSPGRGFGENGEGYVRVAMVENELRLKQAMRQLDKALNRGK
jgi:alanine-synthesizing transaminase